jgi:hypothetical protein
MEYLTTVLLLFVLGCLVHLERVVAKMGAKVSMLWDHQCNNKNNPRPRKSRSRGLDKTKKGV